MPEFETRINLPDAEADAVIAQLNRQLANSIALQLTVKFAHWNVKGEGFFPTHKLFDKIYKAIVEITDTIGERITALGGTARGLLVQVTESNKLSDYTANEEDNVKQHIISLADSLSEFSNSLRNDANSSTEKLDLVTQNMLLGMVETLDKYLYFLEANLRP